MPFNLTKQTGRFAHLNVRMEKHGDEEVLAVDIKIEADVVNDFLEYLAPGLKRSLYDHAEGATEDMLDDAHLPRLRYAKLPDLSWEESMENAVFVIHGKKKAEDLTFEAKVSKLQFSPKEGGTVAISFKAALRPTPEQSGQFTALLGTDVKVSVREGEAKPPAQEQQPDAPPPDDLLKDTEPAKK